LKDELAKTKLVIDNQIATQDKQLKDHIKKV
jgi:hypothetical protein